MDSKQESPLQKGKKRKRIPFSQQSEYFPEDQTPADLSQKGNRTTSVTTKKACLSQAADQANSGCHSNRSLLEVSKLCSAADVLKSLSLVNRQWMAICCSNELSKELWSLILEDLFIPPDRSTHPKTTCAAYIRQQQTVVDLHQNHMDVLDTMTGVWTSTRLSESMPDKHYSYAILFDGSLLCCGGVQVVNFQPIFHNRAYQIALDGEVSAVKPMITGRYGHGIAAYGRKVFVFGGYGSGRDLVTIEQFDETSWSELPTKLNVRHSDFSPSLYKGLIYICDSFRRPMEVFDPKSLTVAILATIATSNECCNAVVGYEGCILAIGKKMVWKWNSERNDSEDIRKPNYVISGVKKRAVIHRDFLYLITNPYRLMINMKTFSRKNFKNLPS